MYIACLFVFVTGGTRSARADLKIPERGVGMGGGWHQGTFQQFSRRLL